MSVGAVKVLSSADFPTWVTALSIASLALGAILAVGVAVDVIRRPQRMAVMNVVWPVTMLFGGVLWLALYLRWGRASVAGDAEGPPMSVSVAKGASHCGAGCMLGDLTGEFAVVLLPGLLAALGLNHVFGDDMYSRWTVDFVLAFLFGVAFQYFAIAPMQSLGVRKGIVQAIKADALSITSWQVGMYGLMAIAQLLILPELLGGRVAVATPEFWWIMQWAMLAGFATAFPVNWWLIRIGIKEAM